MIKLNPSEMRMQRSEGLKRDTLCRAPGGGTLIKTDNRANANFPRLRKRANDLSFKGA